ncbi:MAG TPA: AMP-binding protein [Gemmatimonadales bacterium]|nr:AMP-binding protein [Gemmatimonadales bacterium]
MPGARVVSGITPVVHEVDSWIAPPPPARLAANLVDYETECRSFSWRDARAELEGLPGGAGLNIAHEAVDRHAGPMGSVVALRWLGRDGSRREFSYADLRQLSNRFANVLSGLGIARGDRVVTLLGRVPELHITALGSWKLGAVFCPLFSAFGPSASNSISIRWTS